MARHAQDAQRGQGSAANGALHGVGVAVPGIIETEAGAVRESVNIPALENVNIVEHMQATVTTPLFFEEGSRAKALAEKWFGLGRDVDGFVCIDLGIGIGSGIIHEGHLFKGTGAYAGEIGHGPSVPPLARSPDKMIDVAPRVGFPAPRGPRLTRSEGPLGPRVAGRE